MFIWGLHLVELQSKIHMDGWRLVLLRWQDCKTRSVAVVFWHKHRGGGGGVDGGANP